MPFYSPDWITEPPLRRVTNKTELGNLIGRLRANIADWRLGDESTDEASAWNSRIGSTDRIANLVKSGSDENHVYMFMGAPVGFLILMDSTPTYICDILAHPGASNAGSIMIEFAANRSKALGHGGKLELYSFDEESTRFYLACGFTGQTDSGGTMTLDPAGNDKWTSAGGKWRLKKYAGMSIFNMKAPPPPKPPSGPKPPVPTRGSGKALPPTPDRFG